MFIANGFSADQFLHKQYSKHKTKNMTIIQFNYQLKPDSLPENKSQKCNGTFITYAHRDEPSAQKH